MTSVTTPIARILLVDDMSENLELLSRRLTRAGYECTTATSGQQALEFVHAQTFELVLLDSMMPVMSGPEVLAQLRTEFDAMTLPIVMVTALSESDEVVKALHAGANDYVTKPIDVPVLLARMQTQLELKRAVDQVRQLEADLALQNASLIAANLRVSSLNNEMNADLEAAGDIQRGMLPTSVPDLPGLDCAWAYRPCEQLGGDLLNVFQLTPSEVVLYIFDISGHGVQASLQAVMLHQLLNNRDLKTSLLLSSGPDEEPAAAAPGVVASKLNALFPMTEFNPHYFTLLYCVLNLETRMLRGICAGHPAPLIWQPSGSRLTPVESCSAIGWFEDSEFPEFEVEMTPDLRIMLYSDGLTEAGVRHKESFGTDRLVKAMNWTDGSSLTGDIGRLLETVITWSAPNGFDDDLSMLALQLH